IVVVNGCASVRSGSTAGAGGWEERFSSVAYGFLFGGAMGVVGTLCEVSDRRAAALADAFYREGLSGETGGEALRRARPAWRAAPPGSPAWLSFVLYGNPAQRLADTGDERPVTVDPSETAGAPPVAPPPAPRTRRWWPAAALALGAVTLGGIGYYARPPHAQV